MSLSKKEANKVADYVSDLIGAYEELYDELDEANTKINDLEKEVAHLGHEIGEMEKSHGDD